MDIKIVYRVLLILILISSLVTVCIASPAVWEDVLPFSEGMAPVKVNGKWGFIEKNGYITIAPRYDDVRQFSEGLAAVKFGNYWGYIDKSGQWVIEPAYLDGGKYDKDLTMQFENGLAEVYAKRSENNYSKVFIDKKGNTKFLESITVERKYTPGIYDRIQLQRSLTYRPGFVLQDFEHGGLYGKLKQAVREGSATEWKLAPSGWNMDTDLIRNPGVVSYESKGRHFGEDGMILLFPPVFIEPLVFYEEFAVARIHNKAAYATEMGTLTWLKDSLSGDILKAYQDWNFLDQFPIIAQDAFMFDDARRFGEGLAAVNFDGHWAFLNKKLEVIIPWSNLEDAKWFSEGLAPVKHDGKWKFIDREGKVVIESQ
ncbi:WG repeat-containing protein [Sporomusa malonica]|nr:WG repeat-containing protein [Sporomusa malonica]